MTPEELKALLEKAVADVEAQNVKNAELSTQVKALEAKLEEAPSEAKMEEILNEISDLRGKMVAPIAQPVDHAKALKEVASKSLAAFVKSNQKEDVFTFVKSHSADQFKTLNITNADEGGRAVAEVLSRDVIEYAREYSPILGEIGRKNMTRNYRELVLVTYPSVQEGIENVAGTSITQTTTQEYKEVVSKEFKINAKPRITDEAMYGTDIDIYGQLTRLLGREISIYLAAQVLFGDGTGKNCRGMLSSNRVDITNGTGESFKPTLATDPADARNHDYFPVKATGVSASLGADDNAIVDFVIDVANELPTEYLKGAKWYFNRKTKGVFEKVRDADGNPIFRMNYREGGLQLNGFPVVIDDTMPDIAADSLFAVFGDMSKAFAISDGDVNKMLLDPYSVDGCTVIKTDKEYFEMVQHSDAILVLAATANAAA